MKLKNALIILILALLIFFPLAVLKEAGFSGADDAVKGVVAELHPDYQPWLNALWEPPSGEVESLLFALQAALGAGFIGYFMGYWKAKRELAGGIDSHGQKANC